MHSNRLNCAVVGLGIGEQHALAIAQDKHCNLSAIVDLDSQKAEDFIRNNVLKDVSISSFQDVINDQNISLLSLASFDDDHYEQVMLGLKNNKHVFVEKPLCQTTAQLQNIYAAWRDGAKGLSSNLLLRAAPLYIYVKQIIEQGALGEIYAFDGDYLYGRIEKITEGWRKNVDNYSVMEGGGIHMVDLMLWLTGEKPIKVSSCCNKIATKNTAFRYPDFHSATFTFENALIGRITANFGCIHKHQHVVRIFGTKGTFIFDDMGARIHWSRDENNNPERIDYAPKPQHKGILIHDFVNAIMQDQVKELGEREFDLMSVVLAADKSLSSQSSLTIEYVA